VSLMNFVDFETSGKFIEADKLLKTNMYDYGIDVVSDRALPDYRDGLKPAQRRLFWTANDLKARFDCKSVKSARITGDCMGKYHPHGDAYGSLVSLATNEYPVILGQGNWGSLTDAPASSRYTECKISEIGMSLLECNAVTDFIPNYTGEFLEPIVINSRLPYYFINECSGIAVGLSVNIPPHNLGEVVDALKVVVKKGDKTKVDDIFKFLKAPDYRHGGYILSTEDEIKKVYKNGNGTIKYSCDYTLTKQKKNYLLTVTGYCLGFNPNNFMKRMDALIDTGEVIYVNDSSTKDEPYKLEVMVRSKEDFENVIKKHLEKSESYRYYAVERRKSEVENKDIEIEIISTNVIDLMNRWVEWRRDVETKMCLKEKDVLIDKRWKLEMRLLSSNSLKTIIKSLESEDTIGYLLNNLKGLEKFKNPRECARFICNQRIIELKKTDQEKVKKEIDVLNKEIDKIDKDIKNIDSVVIRELNKLKRFSNKRKVGISW